MKVLLFCGGRGFIDPETRLRIPKCMARIGERPLLWHVMNAFATFGHRTFVLALGTGSETIRDFFLEYGSHWRDVEVSLANRGVKYLDRIVEEDWTVQMVDTGREAMTGGRIARCRRYLDGERFLLSYSDCLCNVDLFSLVAAHAARENIVMTVTGVRPPSRFGTFFVEGQRVTRYSLESRLAGVGGYIHGGFMVAEPSIFQYVEPLNECNLEVEVFSRLAQEGKVAVFPHEGYWQPVDGERELLILNEQYRKNIRPWLPEPTIMKQRGERP
jgi:glucose-1-phosphate cytidylyltransferase